MAITALSVLIPVYNEEQFILACINSVRRQTVQDIEIIIGDNASTDQSWQIIASVAAVDPRVKAIKGDVNVGAIMNLQRMWPLGKSDLVAFIGAHDVLHPRWAEENIARMKADPSLSLSYTRVGWIDENDQIIKESDGGDFVNLHDSPQQRLAQCLGHQWGECTAVNGVFRASVLNNFWFPRCTGPDHVMLARAAFLGRISRVEQALYQRRTFARHSQYMDRIHGLRVWRLNKGIFALVAAHLVDLMVLGIRGKRLLDLAVVLWPAFAKGYRPLGFRSNVFGLALVIAWFGYYVVVVSWQKPCPGVLPRPAGSKLGAAASGSG
jgi:glycosyltransferase involved in cell wall biosynthesis